MNNQAIQGASNAAMGGLSGTVSNGLSSGSLTTNNSTIPGSLWGGGGSGWTLYAPPINHHPTYHATSVSDAFVQKVENGWIVHINGKQFIAKTAEEIIQYFPEDTK